jgi:predicted nucleic acid-binding protein
MGLILHLEQRKLGAAAKSIFKSADSADVTIHIPTLVFAEILYLSEKKRIHLSLQSVANHLQKHQSYREYPMNMAAVQSAAQITDIQELHDRLIAGTARLLNLGLITNDPAIQASTSVKTVW